MKTDKQLLNEFNCDHNHKTFKEFYDRHEAQLRERAFRFLKNREDTEDFLQEFWLRLLNETERIRTNEQEAALGYLIVMLTHDLYDFLRVKELNTEPLDDYLLDKLHQTRDFACNPVEDELYRNEIIANKDRIVADLSEKDQLIYNLYTTKHLTIKEISQLCSISEKTVRNRLAIIKNNIKGQLQVLYAGSYILPLISLIQSGFLW
jgi:RNA polymerase sigma-70 factor (ECF subfamily)